MESGKAKGVFGYDNKVGVLFFMVLVVVLLVYEKQKWGLSCFWFIPSLVQIGIGRKKQV